MLIIFSRPRRRQGLLYKHLVLLTKTLQKKIQNINMDILISNLLLKMGQPIGAKPNLYSKAIELVCGGSPNGGSSKLKIDRNDSFQSIGPLNVKMSVCLCACSLLRYRLNVFLPPLPKVGCPIFLEIQKPWGKGMEISDLRFEYFFLKVV